MKLKKFVSPTDGCKFDYFISNGILSYRMVESQFWHDYNPNNKDYSDYEHKEFQMLLNSWDLETRRHSITHKNSHKFLRAKKKLALFFIITKC